MATQARIVINGKNDISGAVKSTSKDLSSFKDSVSKPGSSIKSSLVVVGATACKGVLIEDFKTSECRTAHTSNWRWHSRTRHMIQ